MSRTVCHLNRQHIEQFLDGWRRHGERGPQATIAYDDWVEVTRSEMPLPAASTTRPSFAEISPTADFAPSTVRPSLRASSVTAPITPSATVVARAVCSAANSAAFALTASLVSPR